MATHYTQPLMSFQTHRSIAALIAGGVFASTQLMAFVLPRTPVGNLGPFAAIILPYLLAVILRWDAVQTVQGMGEVPQTLPALYWPSLSAFNTGLISSALAIAAINIVQGTGVSQSVPNPDGTPCSDLRDIFATGMANIAAGFFRGLPVGGSLGATALNVISGARSRWAAVFAGFWLQRWCCWFPAACKIRRCTPG